MNGSTKDRGQDRVEDRKQRARAAELAIWASLLAARAVGDGPAYLAARSAIVGLHVRVVEIGVAKMLRRLSTQADPDAVRSDGFLGLLDAIEKFEPSRGLAFSTFASGRIRGAILDGLRERMGSSRQAKTRSRRLEGWLSRVEQAKGGRVGLHEAADVAGVSAEDLYRWANRVRQACSLGDDSTVSVEARLLDDGRTMAETLPGRFTEPVDEMSSAEEVERLLAVLPMGRRSDQRKTGRRSGGDFELKWEVPPLRPIVRSYLFDGQTMWQIGERLGLSESRVCQFYAQAMAILRARHEPATKPPATPDATGPPAGR